MKTALACLSAVLCLSACTNDPVTNYQWSQFANGMANAVGQQQADQDAAFYYRQEQLNQAYQRQQLQTIGERMPAPTGSSGWW